MSDPIVMINGTPYRAVALVDAAGAQLDQGADAVGVAAPAGGSGVRGWLSGIYNLLKGTLTVNVNNLAAGIAQVSSRDANGNANGISGNPFYTAPVELGTPFNYVAAAGGIVTATTVALAAADTMGRSYYVRKLQLINTGATATEVYVASGVNALFRIKLPASMTSAMHFAFDDAQLMTAVNTALNFTVVTAGAAVYVNAQGYLK